MLAFSSGNINDVAQRNRGIMKFNTDDLDELIFYSEVDNLTRVEDRILSKKRWSTTHEMVFTDGEKFYQTSYEEPATEMQEVDRWEDADSNSEVECNEVLPVQVTVTKYVRI